MKPKTIKAQISSGYSIMILITILFAVITISYMFGINASYQKVDVNRNNQIATQKAITAHYKWLEDLSESLETGNTFTGSLDPNTCALGHWVTSLEETGDVDAQIRQSLDSILPIHKEIHETASHIIDLSHTDKETSRLQYLESIKPKTLSVIEGLTAINNHYQETADSGSSRFSKQITKSRNTSVLLTLATTAFALFISGYIAKKISKPIQAISEWSDKLAKGVDELEFDDALLNANQSDEIRTMMQSFKIMVGSIQENINVVKKVSEGDLTTFVKIRSSEDRLGKNLYHLVQSNDLMFSDILNISRSVADGSQQIASTSQMLADSASEQASSVQNLSIVVNETEELIKVNVQKAEEAASLSQVIKGSILDGRDKMRLLVEAVQDIKEASDKVSAVIKSIDDIAFQTNILALNAAIEAARAGSAGKGFAVVADEVRDLALKSANAANESKSLIENTIKKTFIGSDLSHKTSMTFDEIGEKVESIVSVVQDINNSSKNQIAGIEQVNTGITDIMKIAESNAAASEESAAASVTMNRSAEELRGEMDKFNLRKRREGQAYIPPEKEDDYEFIQRANEAYRKALEEGRYGFEVITEPNTESI